MKLGRFDIIDDKPNGGGSTPPADGAASSDAALLGLELGSGAGTLGSGVLGTAREPWAARLAGNMGQHHVALLLLSTILLWLIVALPSLGGARGLEVGRPAPRDILAPVTSLVPDREATATRRREAAALVPPVYEGNRRAQEQALSKLSPLLAQTQREYAVRNPLPAAGNPLRWEYVERAARDAVRAVYRRAQIRSDVPTDIAAAQTHIAQQLPLAAARWKLGPTETEYAGDLARRAARFPNLIVDERATQRARRDAQNEAHAVYERVQSGDVLLQAGEIVTPEKWAQLEELNLVAPFAPDVRNWNAPFWRRALAQAALCALLVLLAASYLATLDRHILKKPAALWLAASTPILFLAIFRSVLRVPHADTILIPLAATAAVLLTILLEARIGILVGLLIAAPGVLMAHGDVGLFLSAALSAWIGALSVANISSRRQVAHAALLLMSAAALLALVFGVLRDSPFEQTVSLALWSGVAGVVAVIAGSGLAMVLERPFGITTHLHLLELLAPEEAVLRRMQTEAPGTYTHSLMVSLLAETAAKNVEADSLLCRVGGLYHDIGKLHRPHCFIENQSGENIHDRLPPQLSARLIVAHVPDGLALGNALKVPQPILDMIAQHHGTSRVEYFYRQAVQQCDLQQCDLRDARLVLQDVDEEDFRYPGPRPQSKEAAIVMLADTVEASSRALPQPTPEKLEHHIEAMIGQKLREGELAECDLTLRDLQKVQDSFLHVLRGALHQRIAYPTMAAPEIGDNKDDVPVAAGADTQSPATEKNSRRRWQRRKTDVGTEVAAPEAPSADESANGKTVNRVQHALAESFLGRKTARNGGANGSNNGRHDDTAETAQVTQLAEENETEHNDEQLPLIEAHEMIHLDTEAAKYSKHSSSELEASRR